MKRVLKAQVVEFEKYGGLHLFRIRIEKFKKLESMSRLQAIIASARDWTRY